MVWNPRWMIVPRMVSNMARPFFPWVGGKEKLAPYIRQVFPPNVKTYLEPCGGSGAILLGMPPNPSRLDIYNDLDMELSNLFLCAQEKPNTLLRELQFLPIHSRVVFELYKNFVAHENDYIQNILDDMELLKDRDCFTEEQALELRPIFQERLELFDVMRAAAFYKCVRGSFSGTVTSFGVKPLRLSRFLHQISEASKRLENVVIENKNALQLIMERDSNDTLIYCDPPYYRAERLYRVRCQRRFHIRLWQKLCACEGYVVLSYNDCNFVRQLYRDWFILTFKRDNPMSQKKDAEYGELIITNYDPRPYLAQQLTLFDSPVGDRELVLINTPLKPLKSN